MKNSAKNLVTLLFLISFLFACGGGKKDDEVVIKNIVITTQDNTPIIGNEFQLKANAIYDNLTSREITTEVIWKSSNEEIATVSSSGLVTPKNIGEVVFSADYEDFRDEKSLYVNDKVRVESIAPTGITQTLLEGDEPKVSVRVTMTDKTTSDGNYDLLQFSSSNEEVLTVDGEGRVKAVAPGNAELRIAARESDAHTLISVEVKAAITEISPDKSLIYFEIGHQEPVTPTVTATFSDGKTEDISSSVQWFYSTTNEEDSFKAASDVVRINSNGAIIGRVAGTYYLKPALNDLRSEEVLTLIVEEPLVLVNLNDTQQIKLTWTDKLDAESYEIFWSTGEIIDETAEGVNSKTITDEDTFTLEEINYGTTYYFRIRYSRDGDVSDLSQELKIIPTKGQWAHKPRINNLANGAAAIVHKDKFLVFGGYRTDSEGNLSVSDETNALSFLTTANWNNLSRMPAALADMAACQYGDSIYLFGGTKSDGTFSNQILKYDAISALWSSENLGTLPEATTKASCATVGDTIYILGGLTDTGPSANTYRFDPKAELENAQPSASLNLPRYDHASTVADGIIIVAGGRNDIDGALESVERLDPSIDTNTWEGIHHLEVARSGLGLAYVKGKLYAFGGISKLDEHLHSVEVFTSSSTPWEVGVNMPYPTSDFSFAVHLNNLYLFGGNLDILNSNQSQNASMHFDADLTRWSPNPQPLKKVTDFDAIMHDDELILVGGKYDSDSYELELQSFEFESNLWSNSLAGPRRPSALPDSRPGMASVQLNGDLYTIGGDQIGSNNIGSNTVWRWRPDENTWTFESPINKIRKDACAIAANNQIFIFGGFGKDGGDPQSIINSIEAYNPSTGLWREVAKWNNARSSASCTIVDGLIYLIGGHEELDKVLVASNKVDVFNPRNLSLSTLPSDMQIKRIKPAVTSLNGNIYVFGGTQGTPANQIILRSAEKFMPYNRVAKSKSNGWKFISDLPDEYATLKAFTYKDKILLTGSIIKDLDTGDILNSIFTYE